MRKVTTSVQLFTESNRELKNPNRGLYSLYPFAITDAEEAYVAKVAEYCAWSPDTTLALVEINLQSYQAGEISEAGLSNIDALLNAWGQSGKRLIIRFLYDWDGESGLHEPESMDIILRHMAQLGPLLQRHKDMIFTLQGLFVGSWGEMHTTKYSSADELRQLALTLARISGPDMYLAVRTPAQWRTITRRGADRQLSARLGLFNDGMLGNETDMGTYDMAEQGGEQRSRTDELSFQADLCAKVPNGGEVVNDNIYNNFETAVKDLSLMHVTYLNQDYDQKVFDKWASATVSGEGCFDGLDGFSYIQRRLGYRLLISKAVISRKMFQQDVDVTVSFRNAGFAPLYASPELTLLLQQVGGGVQSFPVEHHLEKLTGGRNVNQVETAQAEIPVAELEKGSYLLFLRLEDPASGQPIFLANQQDPEDNGYLLGTIDVQ